MGHPVYAVPTVGLQNC